MAESFLLQEMARKALAEDIIYGDRTTETLFPHSVPAIGHLISKENLTVAGLDLFQTVFEILDPNVYFETLVGPGSQAKSGEVIGKVFGDGRALLKGERTALNFLQHLCGVATLTRRFVDKVSGSTAKVVDTRKTIPGLRALEKEAVLLGGGYNHRFHLGDLILIKDNHIALAKGIENAVRATRATLSHPLKIEVETKTNKEVEEAIEGGADIIMLDNMSIAQIEHAVSLIRKKTPTTLIEVSGGIHLENISRIAKCGPDLISIGLITHSAPAVDISLEITNDERKVTRTGAVTPAGIVTTQSSKNRSRRPKSSSRS